MAEIPWSFLRKTAINFCNETCCLPKTIYLVGKSSFKCRTEYFLSYVISEMFRTNELFVDSVDLVFVYLFLVRDT